MNAPTTNLIMDRSTYLGGSDTASILGVSPWQSAFMLYQKKIGEYVEEITPAKQKLFDRGHRWEPIVVEMLIDELTDRGHDVEIIARNQRYQDPEYPFLAAEIDLELMVDGEIVNGEAKTVSPFAVKAWGEEGEGEIPVYYQAQVMHGLMIKPRQRTIIAALTGFDDKPRIHWIERDEETIAAIRAKELEFWQRVQDRRPPEPVTTDDVKFLYQRDNGVAMDADDVIAEACWTLKNIKARIKADEAQAEMMATRIKIAMGDAATLLHNGKPLATWRNNKSSEKTDWEAAFKKLSAVAGAADLAAAIQRQHTKTGPGARPFLIK